MKNEILRHIDITGYLRFACIIALFAWISFFPQPIHIRYEIPAQIFFVIFLLILIGLDKKCLKTVFGLEDWPLWLFLVSLWAGTFCAAERYSTLKTYFYLVKTLVLFFYIGKFMFRQDKDNNSVFITICVCSGLVAVIGILEFYFRKNILYEYFIANPYYGRYIQLHPRLMSTQLNPAILGSYLLGCLPFCFYVIRNKSLYLRLLGIFSSTLGLIVIILTFSRGVFGGLIVLILFYLWYQRKKKLVFVSSLFLILFITLYSHQRYPILNRLGFETTVFGQHDIRISSYRINRVNMAFRMLKDHPFAGVGLNQFRVRFQEYYSGKKGQAVPYEFRIPDNMYLTFVSETGIIGTIGFFVFIIFLLKTGLGYLSKITEEKKRQMLIASLSAFVVLLVNMSTYELFYWYNPYILFCLICGFIQGLKNDEYGIYNARFIAWIKKNANLINARFIAWRKSTISLIKSIFSKKIITDVKFRWNIWNQINPFKVIGYRKIIIYALIFWLGIVSGYLLHEYKNYKRHRCEFLLIGLDGASWNVMEPLLNKGKLPNIKRLIDSGCRGNLKTFKPLASEVIWTSIATGKTPEMHGIIDRLIPDPDTGVDVPVSANLRKVRAIWNILSEYEKQVGVVNYLVTWPAEQLNGVMISGNTPDIEFIKYLSKDWSYPRFPNLCSKRKFEYFKNAGQDIFSQQERNKFSYGWQFGKIDDFMVNFSNYLLRNQDFNFFCLYIRDIDSVSHRFWQYLFPEKYGLSNNKDTIKYKNTINKYYIWCDRAIGRILRACGKDTTVMIVSDHGFTERPRDEYWFNQVDYLLEINGIKNISRNGKIAVLKNEPADKISLTKNIKITGDLSPDEFNLIRQEAKEVLSAIKVRETGEAIFGNLRNTKHGFIVTISESDILNNAHHHIIVRNKEYELSDLLIKTNITGSHSEYGVIIFSGKNIRQNKVLPKASIYDITPTVLYYMGLPVAKDMTGRVLTEAFEDNYLKIHPVTYIDTYETAKRQELDKPIRRSPLEEERIKERMRSLGYIQ